MLVPSVLCYLMQCAILRGTIHSANRSCPLLLLSLRLSTPFYENTLSVIYHIVSQKTNIVRQPFTVIYIIARINADHFIALKLVR